MPDLFLVRFGHVDAFEDLQRLADIAVPFSGSNGQSEANTIFSRSVEREPALGRGLAAEHRGVG